MLVFLTPESRAKNWQDSGPWDKGGRPWARQGLYTRLKDLNPACPVEPVDVPECTSEDAIRALFGILLDHLDIGDRVILDASQAAWPGPILAMAVLQYARAAKDVRLQGIHGALEIPGTGRSQEETPGEQRIVPLWDLTPYAHLLEWALALDRFMTSGDARHAAHLAREAAGPAFPSASHRHPGAHAIRDLAQSLQRFSLEIATCRGQALSDAACRVKVDLEACTQAHGMAELAPLLERLGRNMASFAGTDSVGDGIRAARWCLDHDLIQQGFTILEETLVTWMVEAAGGDRLEIHHREVVNQSLYFHRRGLDQNHWEGKAAIHPHIARGCIRIFEKHPNLAQTMEKLGKLRNDINHAGWRGHPAPRTSENLVKKLRQLTREAETFLETVIHRV